MFDIDICTNRVLRIQQTEQYENMEPQDSGDENFTNFSINEILKPDFGRKQLTTEVLNLSRDRTNSCDCDSTKRSPFLSLGSHPLQYFGYRFGAFTNPSSIKPFSDIPITSHNTPQKKCYGLNLEVRKHKDKRIDSTDTYTESREDSCAGSDGESSKSSPVTSPATSPGSSPESAGRERGEKADGGKLWPAWVYCTRYSDRPSAGRKRTDQSFYTLFSL